MDITFTRNEKDKCELEVVAYVRLELEACYNCIRVEVNTSLHLEEVCKPEEVVALAWVKDCIRELIGQYLIQHLCPYSMDSIICQ